MFNSPASNSFLNEEELNEPEVYYPLKLYVCDQCLLVQIDEYKKSGDIFNQDYAYFSSYSKSWVDHAKKYVDMIIDRLDLDIDSYVIEIASNDGYLLQYFLEKRIRCLGIEPSANTAQAAREKGIDTLGDFFNVELAESLAKEGKKADLIIGNNVLAHVPNINHFVAGLKIALKRNGIVTMEFPHLMRLIEESQFDTIYHEHFSYFSFCTVQQIFSKHSLTIFDVEELPTHGGSLRIYGKHQEDNTRAISPNVRSLQERELTAGMDDLSYYQGFQSKADRVKYSLLSFLYEQKQSGAKVVGYGAAAKGNTLLNYCGIKKDLLEFVVDVSPYKQGKFLPGSRIPVVNEDEIKRLRPDYVLILPWNIQDEIINQLSYIREWRGKFVTSIPEIRIF
jgi:SAM-dependent methyltransferase